MFGLFVYLYYCCGVLCCCFGFGVDFAFGVILRGLFLNLHDCFVVDCCFYSCLLLIVLFVWCLLVRVCLLFYVTWFCLFVIVARCFVLF